VIAFPRFGQQRLREDWQLGIFLSRRSTLKRTTVSESIISGVSLTEQSALKVGVFFHQSFHSSFHPYFHTSLP